MRIPVSMEDLKSSVDIEVEMKRLLKLPNYARAFLFMAIKFLNEEVKQLTTIEIATAIQRSRPHTHEILIRFVNSGLIKNKLNSGRLYFSAKDENAFESYWSMAKATIDEGGTNESAPDAQVA